MNKFVRVLLVVALTIVSLQLTSILVGAQGGTWVTGFMIQNQDLVNTANVTIKFYWAEGTASPGALAHTLPDAIGAGLSKSYFTTSIVGLPEGFIGSVVIESDRAVAATVNTQTAGGGSSASDPVRVGTASGVLEAQTGTSMFVTQVLKAAGGWNSYIAVQNTTGDTATVVAHYYDAAGTDVYQHTESVHPYSTYVFRQDSEGGLPATFAGSAKVVSTNSKNLAVICNFYNSGANSATAQFHSYNGQASGATKLYAPRVVKDYYGYLSGLKVQNVGAAATTITIVYTFGGSTYSYNAGSLNPGQAWDTYMGNLAKIPAAMAGVAGSGSAEITSSGQPIVATVNEDNRSLGQGITYNAFLDGAQTTAVLFPQVTAAFYGYNSGVQVQNVTDTAATCTVTYSKSGSPDVTLPIAIGARASWSQYVPNAGVGANFNGSAVVVCDRSIVGIANMSNASFYGDSFTTYNGLNR